MSTVILVVDDDEDCIRIVSTMLCARGFEIRAARDGRAALRAIEEERPDLVLLDIMMPGMDGMQVLEFIRADPRTTSLPVIFLTAKDRDEDVLTGYGVGAQYYVTKPFTARQLAYAISLVLGAQKTDSRLSAAASASHLIADYSRPSAKPLVVKK